MMDRKKKIEYGDFQTPQKLAIESLNTIDGLDDFKSYIEPTCGLGAFIMALIEKNIQADRIIGWEINTEYVDQANSQLSIYSKERNIVEKKDYFQIDWSIIRNSIPSPVLFVGNPPWVTSSELGKLLSNNVPNKRNHDTLSGFDAITGKSNFDISEWMLRKIIDNISGTKSAMAFLIKTSVARKLFKYIAEENKSIDDISIKHIDAKEYFRVSVDACLFSAKGCFTKSHEYRCSVFPDLKNNEEINVIGYVRKKLIKDIDNYTSFSAIDSGCEFQWRSGIKHDSAKIMELDDINGNLYNGLGEEAKLPSDFLYPMYKSSDISKSGIKEPQKYMLVTQKKIGCTTDIIKLLSPETWDYLESHSNFLDSRKSSIYHKAYRFSIFGVGDYTFKPWKIAISGLYKNIIFSKIGCCKKKPIVLDDTCYLLGFDLENEADFALKLLNSESCKNFINSIIFLDSKRPVTVALLNRINLKKLAEFENCVDEYNVIFDRNHKQLKLIS